MQLQLPKELPLETICSWLGCPKQSEIDCQTLNLAEKASQIVLQAAQPRGIYKKGTLHQEEDGRLFCDELYLKGTDISRHLEHCTQAVWLAVTVGVQVDMQIRRLGKDMALVCAVDAAAGVLVEALADRLQREIQQSLEQGQFMTSRYSPGYGDFPIKMQKDVVDYLDGSRKIGLTVNDGGIMIPRKSITAVCGISAVAVKGHLAGCTHCVLREKCNYRKEGKYCGKE